MPVVELVGGSPGFVVTISALAWLLPAVATLKVAAKQKIAECPIDRVVTEGRPFGPCADIAAGSTFDSAPFLGLPEPNQPGRESHIG